jgi:hypothetical protein
MSNIFENEIVKIIIFILRVGIFGSVFINITNDEIPDAVHKLFSHFITQTVLLIFVVYQYKLDPYIGVLNFIMYGLQFYYVNLYRYRGIIIEYFNSGGYSDKIGKDEIKLEEQVDANKMVEKELQKIQKSELSDKHDDDKISKKRLLQEVKDKMNFLGKDDLDKETIIQIYDKYFGIDEEEELEKMYQNASELSPIHI